MLLALAALAGCDSSRVSGCLGPLCFVGINEDDCKERGHCLCPKAAALDRTLVEALSQLRAESRRCGSVTLAPVAAMRWDLTLDTAASDHADDMQFFGFTDPIGSNGLGVFSRVDAIAAPGFRYDQTLIQLVADGESSFSGALAYWLATPSSCMQLMSTNVTHAGIACAGNTRNPARDTNRWSLVLGGG